VTFVIRMALREIRASWRRLLFFFICIAIGVGSIVALRSLIQSVRVALAGEARTLLGADVIVTTNRPWPEPVLDRLATHLKLTPQEKPGLFKQLQEAKSREIEAVAFATSV